MYYGHILAKPLKWPVSKYAIKHYWSFFFFLERQYLFIFLQFYPLRDLKTQSLSYGPTHIPTKYKHLDNIVDLLYIQIAIIRKVEWLELNVNCG